MNTTNEEGKKPLQQCFRRHSRSKEKAAHAAQELFFSIS
jgi:hypothetical protein